MATKVTKVDTAKMRDEIARNSTRKPVNTRGNATLHAQAVALSLHPWRNSETDWMRLEQAVTQLGASAPKAAKNALESHTRAKRALPNPFCT